MEEYYFISEDFTKISDIDNLYDEIPSKELIDIIIDYSLSIERYSNVLKRNIVITLN